MYSWVRPRILIPVHGEAMHMAAHAALARDLGIPQVLTIADGRMVRLAPGPAEVIDSIEAGRLYRDGSLVGNLEAVGVAARRRLAFAGHVGVSLVLSATGELAADPEVELTGIPLADAKGRAFEELAHSTILDTLDSLPRPRRRDPEVVREAVRRAVRSAIAEAWGKKPVCTIFVAVV